MEDIVYRPYNGESDLQHIIALVQNELSEPYVIYTYRYFLHQWPQLSFLAYPADATASSAPIGVIVCKQSMHRERTNRGYIAMLSVSKSWRKRGIASALVRHSMEAMKSSGVEEIVLETEHDNAAALSLYASLGFVREKRLHRFYLNGKDAFRLILALDPSSPKNGIPIRLKDARADSSGAGSSLGSESTLSADGDDDEEEPNVGNLAKLRWKVSNLRASRMVAMWAPDEDYVSGR
ncbi:acyl-CoA N-acyltransferase [Stereum hirsutum FP-91666 SS1]|uniref:acyl-CoA N-acyltransferase n=1 Tax=Stereum hirsutum (strain FP-91666) TaxID=721885 RepID=UPI000444A67B|nr:acyl-CoA N-acyltransferase [Stereum hirsutum FP-91666 SS1]EIM84188.1 acyl-CoA N-acyltransferase [Stereum hirsutum FP-91666 SS1]